MDLNDVKNINFHVGIPSLEEYYLMLAFMASIRANCLNRAVGAVLVTPDNKHILATAYNGVPSGLSHCDFCRRKAAGAKSGEMLHLSRAAHAEQNIFTQVARNAAGSTKDSILYITDSPCAECVKLIINGGIKKVVYAREYPNPEAIQDLRASNIEVEKFDENVIFEKIRTFANMFR